MAWRGIFDRAVDLIVYRQAARNGSDLARPLRLGGKRELAAANQPSVERPARPVVSPAMDSLMRVSA